jgi:hypothetical protein
MELSRVPRVAKRVAGRFVTPIRVEGLAAIGPHAQTRLAGLGEPAGLRIDRDHAPDPVQRPVVLGGHDIRAPLQTLRRIAGAAVGQSILLRARRVIARQLPLKAAVKVHRHPTSIGHDGAEGRFLDSETRRQFRHLLNTHSAPARDVSAVQAPAARIRIRNVRVQRLAAERPLAARPTAGRWGYAALDAQYPRAAPPSSHIEEFGSCPPSLRRGQHRGERCRPDSPHRPTGQCHPVA